LGKGAASKKRKKKQDIDTVSTESPESPRVNMGEKTEPRLVGSKKKPSAKIPKPKPRPTRLKYDSDTAEGAEKQKKARELRDKQASGGIQDTGKNKNKKFDEVTVGMSNKISSDQGKPEPKPTKAKWKVEYGKIIDDVQEEANLNKGGSVKYKSKMKKGGLVTKRGPMHRSSKRKS